MEIRQQILSDFRKFIEKSACKNKISSAIAIGSITTNQFVPGKSDLDIAVVVKKRKYKKQIDRFLTKAIGELDKKYKLNLKRKQKLDFADMLWGTIFGGTIKYYKTHVILVSMEDLDFFKQKINDKKLMLVIGVFTSFSRLVDQIKLHGYVIYGEDLRSKIKLRRLNFIDSLKIFMDSLNFFIASLSNFPNKTESIRNAAKSCIFESEHELFELGRFVDRNSEREWKRIINSKQFSDHLSQAIFYKTSKNIKISRFHQILFISKCLKFIVGTHLILFKRSIYHDL